MFNIKIILYPTPELVRSEKKTIHLLFCLIYPVTFSNRPSSISPTSLITKLPSIQLVEIFLLRTIVCILQPL